MNLLPKILLVATVLLSPAAEAQVRLPRLISDGMVLQRDTEGTLWGWAAKGEKVALAFRGKTYTATAGPDGKWALTLPAQPAGGPYTLAFAASNRLEVKGVLFGDVWVCSGQSNMELPMARVKDKYPEVIAGAANPHIRQFDAPTTYVFKGPQAELPGGRWTAATPQSVLQFSAVGYFFAKDLYATYKVPIGLIRIAVGGSPAEAWLSPEGLKSFPAYQQRAAQVRDSAYVAQVKQQDQQRAAAWHAQLRRQDQGYAKGQTPWSTAEYKATDWKTMTVPGYWADQGLGPVNGVVWFRRELDVPASMAGQPARLDLGAIVDADSVYLNGKFVGTTSYQYPPRKYELPAGTLKTGKNVLVVRVINSTGRGGFVPDKQYVLRAGQQTLALSGKWQYQLGAKAEPLAPPTFFNYEPGGLFNGMVSPLLPYAVKGVIWYQGESNTKKPEEYRQLFSTMITDWRQHWQRPDLPFLYVQLANYMPTKNQPTESNWAALREAQRQTLAVPNTAMAVATDVGEWNDIHPLDKQTVGQRLALAARKLAYGEKKLVASGPLLQATQVKGNKVVLQFADVGGGLVAKGGPLAQFAVAGPDKKYVWAQARIEGNTVVVWNDAVATPVAVRYAWADNPQGANLYNKDGLPASPFQAAAPVAAP
ncbi:sialate O-acetylesterase [Hymenobacter sediminicola]|uniref:Beta galactosidase jelly roll domain-containing protein n=1 Tax=Hymenobacter sediminicola TaxID=2761579 RepID=A0A7G7W5K0_9BACT|nr:sialate O-acetylesterase [Hymenobacter sediminicola]QNH61643.1 beta galactosidase jelly roll domain-containing protein [Hymenobacter sediminicola]